MSIPEAGWRNAVIQLTAEMKRALGNAFEDRVPMMLGTADAAGQPNITFRGTLQVHRDDALAFWARHSAGSTMQSITANPKVVVVYRNPGQRQTWSFYGRARIAEEPQEREAIFARSPEFEQQQDPERKGAAVIIEIDRVLERGQVVMER